MRPRASSRFLASFALGVFAVAVFARAPQAAPKRPPAQLRNTSGNSSNPKIRAVTALVNLDWRNYQRQIAEDRKSTRLNSSHGYISYAVFCLQKKIVSGAHARYDALGERTGVADVADVAHRRAVLQLPKRGAHLVAGAPSGRRAQLAERAPAR